MKSKSKNFIIPLVVYPFDVMVSLGETDEQLKKALSKYNVEWETFMECELPMPVMPASTLNTSARSW